MVAQRWADNIKTKGEEMPIYENIHNMSPEGFEEICRMLEDYGDYLYNNIQDFIAPKNRGGVHDKVKVTYATFLALYIVKEGDYDTDNPQ